MAPQGQSGIADLPPVSAGMPAIRFGGNRPPAPDPLVKTADGEQLALPAAARPSRDQDRQNGARIPGGTQICAPQPRSRQQPERRGFPLARSGKSTTHTPRRLAGCRSARRLTSRRSGIDSRPSEGRHAPGCRGSPSGLACHRRRRSKPASLLLQFEHELRKGQFDGGDHRCRSAELCRCQPEDQVLDPAALELTDPSPGPSDDGPSHTFQPRATKDAAALLHATEGTYVVRPTEHLLAHSRRRLRTRCRDRRTGSDLLLSRRHQPTGRGSRQSVGSGPGPPEDDDGRSESTWRRSPRGCGSRQRPKRRRRSTRPCSRTQRSIRVRQLGEAARDADKIFAVVNDFHRWHEWSPYENSIRR